MGRRRKKRARLTDPRSLQVELLEVSGADRSVEAGAADAPADAPSDTAATPDAPAATPAPAGEPEPRVDDPDVPAISQATQETVDRWAKAVGQLKGTRRREMRRAQREGGPEAVQAESEDVTSPGVRPAGEPLARARDLVEQGRIQEAIQLYLGILTVNPGNLKAHNNLGVLYDELKRFEAALEHFEEAERLSPENVEVLANYASTLTSLARYDQAEEMLRRAQRISPEDLRARLGVGVLYFRRGLYGQAETELRWVCSRDEANGPAYYYRGEALNRLGRYDEAVEAMERAVVLMPNDPRPFYSMGHLLDRRHQPELAADMYRRARRLQST